MPLHITRKRITDIEVDAVIIAVNERMLSKGYGSALKGTEKSEITNIGKNLDRLSKGEVIVTQATSKLPYKKVMYTKGTEWKDGKSGEKTKFRSSFRKCLNLAIKENLESVAFFLVSAEACGYPIDDALREAEDVAKKTLEKGELEVYLLASEDVSYNVSNTTIRAVREYVKANYDGGSSKKRASKNDNSVTLGFTIHRSLPGSSGVHYRTRTIREHGFSKRTSSKYGSTLGKSRINIAKEILSPEAENILQFIGGIDKSFQKTLFEYIDKKGMTDVQVYKAANVSKKVFSDIRCDPNYHPSKATAISFALSLHLGLEDTERLLRSAGYSLSKSFEIDVAIEYFIKTGKYKDVLDVNGYLYELGLEPLGCLKERKKEKA